MSMTPAQVRRLIDGMLSDARQADPRLVLDERETAWQQTALDTATRGRKLMKRFDSLLAGGGSPAQITTLSAEIRLGDRLVAEMVGKIHESLFPPRKSERHVASVNARWAKRTS